MRRIPLVPPREPPPLPGLVPMRYPCRVGIAGGVPCPRTGAVAIRSIGFMHRGGVSSGTTWGNRAPGAVSRA